MAGPTKHGPISWMVHNPVAANLLMLFLLVGGLIASLRVKQEVFPPFELDTVSITVSYPGASPAEVEQGVILAIEEEVRGLDGVKEVNSSASEGVGSITVELLREANVNKAQQDIKNAVDRITTLPEEAERPVVSLLTVRNEVISVVVYGDQEEAVIRDLAETVRNELLQDPSITSVELVGVRPLEISIEVPQAVLRTYGITLEEIADRVRTAAVELPGGGVKTSYGEILLRVAERHNWGRQFARLPVVTRPDGTQVLLGEIATVNDGLADTDTEAYFNGKTAAMIKVYRVGDQTPIKVAAAVKKHIKDFSRRLPAGVALATWFDLSEVYQQRIDLLLRNAYLGLVLVLLLLGLFLEIRLAFWVTLGIPVSFLGAMLILPTLSISINMVSLFAFIIALGIVVDDAIVVGENIYKHRQGDSSFIEAAIRGAHEVLTPVTFSVLTNMVAFIPLFFIAGPMGKVFWMIPIVVISLFTISLVEAFFILPAHLGHARSARTKGLLGVLHRFQRRISLGLEWAINNLYRPVLRLALTNRYLTVSIGLAVLLVILAYVKSGRIGIITIPKIESDLASANLRLPYGSSVTDTRRIQGLLLEAAWRVINRHGGKEKLVRGIFTEIGANLSYGGGHGRVSRKGISGGNEANVRVFLVPTDQRDLGSEEFVREWRREIGQIPGIETLTFKSEMGGPSGGNAIKIRLKHTDTEILERAATELAASLEKFNNVKDIDDGFSSGKPQLDFKLNPAGRSLGLTAREIGHQVRSAFYGSEALRQQRGREEIKVMLRLPESERCSEFNVEELMLRTPTGGEVPLREVTRTVRGRAYTSINRVDGSRTTEVTADVIPRSEANKILAALKSNQLPKLTTRHPGLRYSFEGQHREQRESMVSLGQGMLIVLIAIFAMLAIPFRSYIQPLIIMVSIPFGIVGAIIGHLLMNYDLSLMSMLGMVALSGVVVNDSLVLIDFVNRQWQDNASPIEAIVFAATRRFRPIMLTSLTTFGGLAPMIFETSMQARFLIPMAISLGYGILFATLIALLLVPALYLITDDIKRFWRWLWSTGTKKMEEL